MLVASWDKHVYLYDTDDQPGGRLIRKFEHRAPVLDVCWGKDENEAFSGGLDRDVRRFAAPIPRAQEGALLTAPTAGSTSRPATRPS